MRLVHPFTSPSLEPEIRAVADVALASGTEVCLKAGLSPEDLSDPLCRIAFCRAAHEGFVRGQASIIDRILHPGLNQLSWQDELTFRKIVDAIAWQMLSRQLYVARRLYRQHDPVPLSKRSNLRSVIEAAEHWQKDDLTKFALVSDLSTFIHVGDLLISEPLEGKLFLAEVKTGQVNGEVMELLFSMPRVNDEQVQSFFLRHGSKGFKQLERSYRQAMRMFHVAEVVNSGASRDPDSNQMVRVAEQAVEVESYDLRLSDIMDRARRKKWACDVIDDCLFVAVFRGPKFPPSDEFRSWLQDFAWHNDFPLSGLVASMVYPLALPLFSREMDPEHIFDTIFGRAVVYLGFHVDNFRSLSNKIGLPMRWSSRKEAGFIPKKKIGLKVDNRVLLAGEGEWETAVGAGSVFKIFFHGLTPRLAIDLLARQVMASQEGSP